MERPTTQWIRDLRPPKPEHDPWKPLGAEVEPERAREGDVVPVGTAFLTNRECPFTCLMCDLWQYTTDDSVPVGAVDRQLEIALESMPDIRQIKLYNAGNFFDDRAVSPEDRSRIARRLGHLDAVIIENHPRMVDERIARFRDELGTELDVAMGLETVHPTVLPRLNKGMTTEHFAAAAERLVDWGVHARAFVLLRPPWLTEEEGVEWACRSIDFAIDAGVECVSVIPTRGGNGVLEVLAERGDFVPPSIASLERVVEYGVTRGLGRAESGGTHSLDRASGPSDEARGQPRVFGDLWDIERFATCATCGPQRKERLHRMNLEQRVLPAVVCTCRPMGA